MLPLHHPVRVAEDWAVIDQLSQGRAALAVASGWTMDEFILSRDPHGSRRTVMWKSLKSSNACGKDAILSKMPMAEWWKPKHCRVPYGLQSQWITSQSTETFIEAGRTGAHVLTSLPGGDVNDVAGKIRKYRMPGINKVMKNPKERYLLVHIRVPMKKKSNEISVNRLALTSKPIMGCLNNCQRHGA